MALVKRDFRDIAELYVTKNEAGVDFRYSIHAAVDDDFEDDEPGMRFSRSTTSEVADKGFSQVVKALIGKGADVNHAHEEDGCTPLIMA